MAIWIAGPAFRCKGEALLPEYKGMHLRPDALKRNTSRLYQRIKKNREEKLKSLASPKKKKGKKGLLEEIEDRASEGWPVDYLHDAEKLIGDTTDAYVDKDMRLWVVMRLSPGQTESSRIIKAIKKKSPNDLADEKENEFGISLTYTRSKKTILAVSLTPNPAHRQDGTFVRIWGKSREDLLRRLFESTYGESGSEDEHKPYFMTNALRADVKKLFSADAEGQPVQEEEAQAEETDDLVVSSEDEEEEEKAKEGKAEEEEEEDDDDDDPMDLDSQEKSGAAGAGRVFDGDKVKDSKAPRPSTASSSSVRTKDKSVPEMASKSGGTVSGSGKKATPSLRSADGKSSDKSKTTTDGKSGKLTKPSAAASKKQAPKVRAEDEKLKKEQEKKTQAKKKEGAGLKRAPPQRLAKDDEDVSSQQEKSEELEDDEREEAEEQEARPSRRSASRREEKDEEEEHDAASGEDEMSLDEEVAQSAAEEASEEEQAAADDEAEEKDEAEEDAMDLDEPTTKEKKSAPKQKQQQQQQAQKKQSPSREPAQKKQKLEGGKGKSSYPLDARDLEISNKELERALAGFIDAARLADAPPAEQQAYLKKMLTDQKSKLLEKRQTHEEILSALCSEHGLSEEASKALVREFDRAGNTKSGQVMKTLVSMAAGSHAQDPRLLDFLQGRSGPVQQRALTFGGSSSAPRLSAPQASIFGRPSAGLDFSDSIFSRLFTQPSASQPSSRIGEDRKSIFPSKKQKPSSRLGKESEPVLSDEEKAAREQARLEKNFLAQLQESGKNIIRQRVRFGDKSNPLASIRTEDGEAGIDGFDLDERLLGNIRAGSYAHQFLSALTLGDLSKADEREYVTWGHDDANEAYRMASSADSTGQFATRPRRILGGGTISIGYDA